MTLGRIRVGARDTAQVRLEVHLVSNNGADLFTAHQAEDVPPLLNMTDHGVWLRVVLGIFQALIAFRISVWSRVCFCYRCHSEGVLAINVADVGATREAAANPAG